MPVDVLRPWSKIYHPIGWLTDRSVDGLFYSCKAFQYLHIAMVLSDDSFDTVRRVLHENVMHESVLHANRLHRTLGRMSKITLFKDSDTVEGHRYNLVGVDRQAKHCFIDGQLRPYGHMSAIDWIALYDISMPQTGVLFQNVGDISESIARNMLEGIMNDGLDR